MTTSPQPHGPGKLNGRHVQFIAIGGAIGAGLFVGSSEVISQAGPAVMFAYALCGFVIFLIARALGELAIKHPDAGGFSTYAAKYIGGWAGFVTGWSYWLNWVLVIIAEITAIGLLIQYWAPSLPQWVPGLVALAGVWLINMAAARVFAEAEFAITLVKVSTIVILIAVGAGEILTHHKSGFGPAKLSNLWVHGVLPSGPVGFLNILPLILFAFGGVEVIGVAAAEMEEPAKVVPKAINATVFRILLFYVGSLAIVMCLVPWTSIHAGSSPFVLAFGAIGLPGAAGVVNFVVLTAVISACNTGVFATSRVLRGLSLAGQAPAALAKLSKRGVPSNAMTLSVLCMLGGVVFNYVAPKQVFSIIMRADAALMLWIWLTIVWSHMNYRRREGLKGEDVAFGLAGAPFTNIAVMVFMAFICAFNFVDLTSTLIFLLSLGWFGALVLIYAWLKRRPRSPNEVLVEGA